MYCSNCKAYVSVRQSDKWVSMKCKCKCALYYPDGYFTVIPKEVYLKKKEEG